MVCITLFFVFFFNDTATTEIYTLSLHDALPIYRAGLQVQDRLIPPPQVPSVDRYEVSPDYFPAMGCPSSADACSPRPTRPEPPLSRSLARRPRGRYGQTKMP